MKELKQKIDFSLVETLYSADVVVIGGGCGGLGAAVFAARSGMKVILVEQYGVPGGMSSMGGVQPFMTSKAHGENLDRPVFEEWQDKIAQYIPENWDGIVLKRTSLFSAEAAALGAEDLLLESGVELLYHHTLVAAETKDRKISRVILHSKNGFVGLEAKMFVDCSGDGDLAAMAGCEFEFGDEDGVCQPLTVSFKLSNVKLPQPANRLWEDYSEWRQELQKLFKKGQSEGKISVPRETLLFFSYFENDVLHFNTTRVLVKNPLNGKELAEAEVTGRKQMREIVSYLKENSEDFRDAYISDMSSVIGVRESRRIKGIRYLSVEAFHDCAKFEDAIARCSYPIDKHSGSGKGTKGALIKPGDFYEIPYGCIVPEAIDNLTIGGRPISVDVYIHASMRIMPCACSVGQAAGCAAAEAVKRGVIPAAIDGVEIRNILKNMGANL